MSRQVTLRLYKEILYCARRFPSIKRDKIVEEIRAGFRANRNVSDPDELRKLRAVAVDGLEKLSMYTSLQRGSIDWAVSLEKNPLPKSS
jgi:hypothetical protein